MNAVRKFVLWMQRSRNALLYPVRRKLCVCVLAYMAGVLSALLFAPPFPVSGALLFVLAAAICRCLRRKRNALFPVCLAFFVAGNWFAAMEIRCTDQPTPPKTQMRAVVAAIESDYRVILDDVVFEDGTTTNRPVRVKLMNKDDEPLPEAPCVGQQISGIGRLFAQDSVRNPGGSDWRISAINDGYELSGYLLPGWTAEGEERFSVREMFRQLRLALLEKLNLYFGEDAAMFAALMLGEKSDIDPELKSAMQLTGTAHILSVSGMHLTMISSAVYALLSLLPIGKKAAYSIQAMMMLFFAGLTGFAVGTVRALLMQMLGLLARLSARRYEPLTAVAFAALIITVHSPLMVLDAGFQFSFFVVLGIHLLMGPINDLAPMRWLDQRAHWFAQMLTLSMSAQLAALPMQLSLYGYAPVLALPMNLFAGIVIPFMMIGGWILLLVGLVLPPFAAAGAALLMQVSGLFETVSLCVSRFRGSIVRLPSPGRWMLPVFGAVMALLSTSIRFGRWRYRVLASVLVIAAAMYLPRLNPAGRYVQLDVGQGDASLIRLGREAVVVDVGPEDSYDLIRYLRHEGLCVHTLIFSHLDEDHAGALDALCRSEIDFERVVMADRALEDVPSEAVRMGISRLAQNGIQIDFAQAGDEFDALGIHFDVLSPAPEAKGSNERSLLLHAKVGEAELLLTGDLPEDAEPDVIPSCDILKVAHHGSKNASSMAFLSQAQPQIAIISAGAGNSYGHPHARVLEDLNAVGAKVFRTDDCGCVTVWLDEELNTRTFVKR